MTLERAVDAPAKTRLAGASVEQPARFVPLGGKLTLGTLLVVGAVSVVLYVQLIGREQQSLLAAKTTATGMVADVVASSLVAALDFEDVEAAAEGVRSLRGSRDLLYAGVWSENAEQPLGEIRGMEELAPIARPMRGTRRTTPTSETLDQVRPVTKPDGRVLGHVLLRYTLAPENTAYRESRTRLSWLSLLLAGATSLMLLVLARLLIVSPLGALVAAANQLREGGVARVSVRANDEMGRLGEAFNGMAASIADRERRLAASSRELRQVLDNMVQAIVVFGPGGRIDSVPSGATKQIFPSVVVGGTIAETLFPNAPKADVEARAFDVFVEAAFEVPNDRFAELAELAPPEATLSPPGGDADEAMRLELAFRLLPVDSEAEPTGRRVMLVATDVTEKRRLEQAVRRLDEQHTHQMSGMRRLLAGGGQVFLAFLQDAEARLARAIAVLDDASPQVSLEQTDELFRHFHTLKGESRGFGLDALLVSVEALEALLAPLRARVQDGLVARSEVAPALREGVLQARRALDEGRDIFVEASPIGRAAFDQITVDRNDLQLLASLAPTLSAQGRVVVERLTARPFGESTFGLVESVPTWATQAGKRVRIELEGRETRVPPTLQPVLPAMLTHLVRNAIAHGIERSDERLAAGKPPVGVVRLRCDASDDGVCVTVSDDGAGLDEKAVRAAYSAHAAGGGEADLSVNELVFLSGLTSAAEVTELAGRGVGLAAVREDARRVGYAVTVSSTPNEGLVIILAPALSTSTRARAGSS